MTLHCSRSTQPRSATSRRWNGNTRQNLSELRSTEFPDTTRLPAWFDGVREMRRVTLVPKRHTETAEGSAVARIKISSAVDDERPRQRTRAGSQNASD